MNQYVNDFTDTVRTYYNDLKKYKPLTKTQEKKLLKKCKKGSLEAKNEILESNLKFVFDVAKHYTGRGVSISELISEGNMGLLKAIDKFDTSKNIKFISYAVWWIRQAMLESIKKKNVINFVEIEPNIYNDDSIDKKLIEDDEDDNVLIPEYSNEFDEEIKEINENKKEVVEKLLGFLNDREREIVESYYGLKDDKGMTLCEIGKKYDISAERIRQIKKQSLKKLRTQMLLLDDELKELII